ncbi:hypothetical protein HUT18_30370 [Streptomyces sp. NA04227]|uniref:hypothetical protein n=1 Tax=Streptomyces sp. NA04227 TaxID=2742136 RepID=UPI00158FF394|nr:hypothetical protein [Streptomyces sp. NA04227]QKW10086.1 hypothetical protein HUT18_30370 [Streptomyces sp. NA04227]
MKKILEGLGLLMLAQGAGGLVHELFGWLDGWGFVQRIGFLDGYELYASLTLVALSVALFAAAESRPAQG